MDQSIARNPVPIMKKALRQTLLEARLQAASRPAVNAALGRRVLDVLKHFGVPSVGFYWPLAGEFDARGPVSLWLAGDDSREASLPIIKERGTALEFHAWHPQVPMRVGHHKIAEPTSGRIVVPDLLFVPCVGFDADCYRLGYGGGYYDRTLASWPAASKPITVGIAYDACRIDALQREAHDIPLDLIVTETGFHPGLPE
ncbi:5-formyltetrahydrofolate cyclo-ligase [Paraburkholderia sp. MMS20-SJTR3]|uniref:5-formyltetrahydrofolate cyclo-ligase n=1 Tax=Paraburkholderia sejongensis TaxID=2886946 RepID=A0ABS8JTE3_9BURK|nr:5-formyltetrahydrofolate cyclo-ligase [Paraburkholderia sp. MMS20-SJTR3]MCC8393142.1 5-formyltetrahydrofolate cyclo-ligase [Paraburkholderia sp. MMS20-SJTR3]